MAARPSEPGVEFRIQFKSMMWGMTGFDVVCSEQYACGAGWHMGSNAFRIIVAPGFVRRAKAAVRRRFQSASFELIPTKREHRVGRFMSLDYRFTVSDEDMMMFALQQVNKI